MWWLRWTSVSAISLKVGWKARPPRLLTDRWRLGLEKSPWLVTLFERCEARSATEATVEPPVTVSRNQGAKIPDGHWLSGRRASIGQRDGAARGTPYLDRRRKKRDIEEKKR